MAKKTPRKKPRTVRRDKDRASKVVENTKTAMFIKGPKTSAIIVQLLKDLYSLKKPEAVMYQRHNNFRPFEDETQIEFFSQKNDSSLFAFGVHQKKRPHTLILGRLFDHHILDMMELQVTNFKSIADFKECPKSAIGNKPCFIFKGEEFDTDSNLKKFRSIIVDFFRGKVVDRINLAGLDHAIVCTAEENKTVHFKHYYIKMLKSGTKVPRVELEEMGPSFDATVGRTKFASTDLERESLKIPRQLIKKKEKNIETNALKETIATVHMERQDLSQMALRKMKGLKRSRDVEKPEEDGAADDSQESRQSKRVRG